MSRSGSSRLGQRAGLRVERFRRLRIGSTAGVPASGDPPWPLGESAHYPAPAEGWARALGPHRGPVFLAQLGVFRWGALEPLDNRGASRLSSRTIERRFFFLHSPIDPFPQSRGTHQRPDFGETLCISGRPGNRSRRLNLGRQSGPKLSGAYAPGVCSADVGDPASAKLLQLGHTLTFQRRRRGSAMKNWLFRSLRESASAHGRKPTGLRPPGSTCAGSSCSKIGGCSRRLFKISFRSTAQTAEFPMAT